MKKITGTEIIHSVSTDLYCKIVRLPVRVKSSREGCVHTGQANRRIQCYILSKGWDVQFQRAIRAIYTFTAELVKTCSLQRNTHTRLGVSKTSTMRCVIEIGQELFNYKLIQSLSCNYVSDVLIVWKRNVSHFICYDTVEPRVSDLPKCQGKMVSYERW